MSCADPGCRGYELVADLDFDTNGSGGPDAGDAWWNDGAGWLPIGTAAEPFAAAFEGNGRVIRHLLVAGTEGAGLFGATGASSVVARVGLLAVDVTGTRAVGALAGRNGGRVTAAWATGRVLGTEASGGLVGSNTGDIGGSYAAVAVSGERQAGGLAGVNEGGLAAVYATGRVAGVGGGGRSGGAAPRDGDGELRHGSGAGRGRGGRPGGGGERAGDGDGELLGHGDVGPCVERGGPGADDGGAAAADGLRRAVRGLERGRGRRRGGRRPVAPGDGGAVSGAGAGRGR